MMHYLWTLWRASHSIISERETTLQNYMEYRAITVKFVLMPKFQWRCWILSNIYQERKKITCLLLMIPASQHAGLWAVKSKIVCLTIFKLMFLVAVINLLLAQVIFVYIRLQLGEFLSDMSLHVRWWQRDSGDVMWAEMQTVDTAQGKDSPEPTRTSRSCRDLLVFWDEHLLRKILSSKVVFWYLFANFENNRIIQICRLLRAQKEGHKRDLHKIPALYIWTEESCVWSLW